jgi:pimeloyl-ACP methyl ester carboxylesterase
MSSAAADRPVVFLHGNGAMIDGYSWPASEQAALIPKAFVLLGIKRPIVVGHSWGTLVAAGADAWPA